MMKSPKWVALSIMMAVLAILPVSFGKANATLQWKEYEDTWVVSSVRYLGVQPTGETRTWQVSPQEAVDETGAYVASIGTSYLVQDTLPPDLMVTPEALEAAIGQPLAGNDTYKQVILIPRKLEPGEFFSRVDILQGDVYEVVQTCYRSGTADMLDEKGTLLATDVEMKKYLLDAVSTHVYIGVPPIIQLNYYKLDHREDLAHMRVNPDYPVKYHHVDTEMFVMEGSRFVKLVKSAIPLPQANDLDVMATESDFTSPANP